MKEFKKNCQNSRKIKWNQKNKHSSNKMKRKNKNKNNRDNNNNKWFKKKSKIQISIKNEQIKKLYLNNLFFSILNILPL